MRGCERKPLLPSIENWNDATAGSEYMCENVCLIQVSDDLESNNEIVDTIQILISFIIIIFL